MQLVGLKAMYDVINQTCDNANFGFKHHACQTLVGSNVSSISKASHVFFPNRTYSCYPHTRSRNMQGNKVQSWWETEATKCMECKPSIFLQS